MAGHTLAQRILSSHTTDDVAAGRIINANIDLALSHDNSLLIKRRFTDAGRTRIWDPSRVVVTLDHRAPAPTAQVADGHRAVRAFLAEQGVDAFYDVGHGICHQVLPEEGHVHPGMTLVGTDSHTTTHGAFGAFATGIGATEMAAVWATGQLWFRVPPTIAIGLHGRLDRHVSMKDVVLHLIGQMGMSGADARAIEYRGSLFDSLSVDSRMTLSNLSMEMGAKVAFCPVDQRVVSWLDAQRPANAERPAPPSAFEDPFDVRPDDAAVYERTIDVDVSELAPQVACPHSVDNVHPVDAVAGTPIDQVFIGTCTNGRLEDLAAAADVLDGHTVAVRTFAVPASRRVFKQALQAGIVERLTDAGVTFQSPGCGPCLGAHQGLLGSGEACFSTTNRNFRGRMGHIDSNVYLGSPATAAATAIHGAIADPRDITTLTRPFEVVA